MRKELLPILPILRSFECPRYRGGECDAQGTNYGHSPDLQKILGGCKRKGQGPLALGCYVEYEEKLKEEGSRAEW